MPNLRSEVELPKGYFFESDKHIEYEQFVKVGIPSPENTISLVGYGPGQDYIYYRLLDYNEELLSLLRLVRRNFCGQDFYQIHKIGSPVRKKGYATYLYNIALQDCGLSLISDSYLTRPGSYNIWQSLIRNRFSSPYKITVLDTQKCNEIEYNHRKEETFYWGFDLDMLEVYKDDIENLEYQLNDNIIDEDTYDFFRENLDRIEDKSHLRFLLTSKGGIP